MKAQMSLRLSTELAPDMEEEEEEED